jgi:CubicO group peptidase (beta-lactamase class C family)
MAALASSSLGPLAANRRGWRLVDGATNRSDGWSLVTEGGEGVPAVVAIGYRMALRLHAGQVMNLRSTLATVCLLSGIQGQAPCNSLAPFVAIAQEAIAQLQLPGLVLRLDQHGQNVLLQTFGTHQVGTVMPLASASKPLAAAVLMSLVDQGLLALDDPVGLYLPEYAQGQLAAITLRMCFAHTSGLPTFDPVTSNPAITLRQSAAQIALLPLHFVPGTAFDYGNVSMQVAGAVCEVVTGVPWETLFQQRIAGPLGMTSTTFTFASTTLNPGVADGAWSNAEDYTHFLEMLRGGGQRNGVRVLSEAATAEMLTDQIGTRPVLWTPHPFGVPCGLGMWLERQDALGRTLLACAPGAFGFFGWLDREHEATGVWLATTFYVWNYPYLLRSWDATDVALAPRGVVCSGSASPPCASSPQWYATAWARDGMPDFGVAVRGGPVSALGAASFGIGPPLSGSPLFDLVNYVPGPASLVVLPTDAHGDGALSFALPPGLTGLTFTLQGLWLDPQPCGVSGLVATRALRIDIGS